MTTDFIYGIIVPILTPIDEDERIREAKLREQVDFVIDGGVNGILAFGSNGEFYMVEEDEMYRGLQIILDQARGRVPVYMGIGAISTKKCIHIAEMAKCSRCEWNFRIAADVYKAHRRGAFRTFLCDCISGSRYACASLQQSGEDRLYHKRGSG